MTILKRFRWRAVRPTISAAAFAVFCYGCASPGPASTSPAPPLPSAARPDNSPKAGEWSENWTPLFDGSTLTHWAVSDFAGHGAVRVQDHQIRIEMGEVLTGINWTNGALPTTNYEISLEAMKLDGSDFFCGLTFPVRDSWCSLIVGGWGGGVVGLSSIDGADASENETTKSLFFDVNHWYHIRVQVRADKILAWLDNEKIIDVSIAGRQVELRAGPIYLSKPLGVAAYETAAALRDFKLRLIQ